jgi:glycogen operon protein
MTWIDWEAADDSLLDFTQRLIRFQHGHPAFRRRKWFEGRSIRGSRLTDIGWFRPDGEEMTDADWSTWFARSLAIFINGEGIPTADPYGRRILDDSFYLIFNAHWEPLGFQMPEALGGGWELVLDTAAEPPWRDPPRGAGSGAGKGITAEGRSTVLLYKPRREEDRGLWTGPRRLMGRRV